MIVGFDYWQVVSHYPHEFALIESALFSDGYDTHIISAVGKSRANSVAREVAKVWPNFESACVHEVLFDHPRQSPELKLAKCKELGITMFFDDRSDVVDMLNANGILAFLVPRKRRGQTDQGAERV